MLSRLLAITVALALSLSAASTKAVTVVIDATSDTYIRGGSQANNNFNNKSLIGGSGHYPLFQFDLNSVAHTQITSAYIRGYLLQDPDGDYQGTGSYEHRLYLARTDPNHSVFNGGMNEASMTFSIYAGDWNNSELLQENLGAYSEPGPGVPNQYKDFGAATANDLAALNTRATLANASQRFALFFMDNRDPWRWWGDHESGHPLQLVLEVAPEAMALNVYTDSGKMALTSADTTREIFGYEIVSGSAVFDQTKWNKISSTNSDWTVLTKPSSQSDLSEFNFDSSVGHLLTPSTPLELTGNGGFLDAPGHRDLVARVTLESGNVYIPVRYLTTPLPPTLPGDYNEDGTVNLADYTVWRDSLGMTGTGLQADGTGPGGVPDGLVDALDYAYWKAHFGTTNLDNASLLAAQAVPEPMSCSVCLLALLLFSAKKRAFRTCAARPRTV